MNVSTIVLTILFIILVALIVCYMFHKGIGCSCNDCSHCGTRCHKKQVTSILLTIVLSVATGINATAQTENERLCINMKDGTAYRISLNKLAGLRAFKTDVNGTAAEDYQALVLVTKDGKGAALPLKDILRINHINGEPTDGAYGATWYEIQREWNEHAEVVMLNSINNYNNGIGAITQQYGNNWCGQRTGYPVFFLATADLGYDVEFSVRGLDSGYLYSDYSGYVFWLAQNDERNTTGQSCWCFYMGEEPVIIEAKATENTAYEEYPWLGDYYGHPMLLTENRLYSSDTPNATRLSLKGNKSYIFSSTATERPVTSSMLYEYTEGKFSYTPDPSTDLTWRGEDPIYALTGYWLTDKLLFVRADDINHDKPENALRYFMLKDASTDFSIHVGAKDNWNGRATQYLVELTYDGQQHYYFLDNYGSAIHETTVEFTEGTTIAGKCRAIVTYTDNYGDEHKFTYSTKDGSEPSFEEYKKPDPELPESAEWTGANLFQNEAADGFYDGVQSQKHHVYIRMDQNVNGSSNKGYCSIRVDFSKGYSYDTYAISSGGQYVYNPKAGTITVSQVLMGVVSGGAQERQDLVLKVSNDLKTITFDETAHPNGIWSSRTNTYLTTGPSNPLNAVQ